MANVKAACDVGWRTRDNESFPFVRIDAGLLLTRKHVFRFVEALSKPPMVPCGFNSNRVVASRHRRAQVYDQ